MWLAPANSQKSSIHLYEHRGGVDQCILYSSTPWCMGSMIHHMTISQFKKQQGQQGAIRTLTSSTLVQQEYAAARELLRANNGSRM